MAMSHSLTCVIGLVDYSDSLIVKAEVPLVAGASCPAVYPFAKDDDLMEVELVAVALVPAAAPVALDSIPFVERPDWVEVQTNSYCTSVFDDNNVRPSNYSADGVGYAWESIVDTSASSSMDPCGKMKHSSTTDGKYSALAIEIHLEEMYCYYRSYPLKDNQKIVEK